MAVPTPSPDSRDNPVDRLANLIDALDEHVRTAESTLQREQGNRISILYVHAVFALLVGPTFAAIGQSGMTSAIWTVARLIPGAPGSLAVVMFTGGVVLTVATTFRNRRWEIVGLTLLIVWYATIAVSFGASVMQWTFRGQVGPRPSFYAPLVYAHFLTIMLVHCWTLRKMMRATRRHG